MQRRPRVYVAGPISKGDRYHNVHQAIVAGRQLVRLGFAPFVPHLDQFMFPHPDDLSWQDALSWDIPWVLASDVVFRLPGVSEGADLECEVADEAGIPVFNTYRDLVRWQHEVWPKKQRNDGQQWHYSTGGNQ